MVTFFDLMVVESDGWDGVLFEGAISDGLDEGGFACILETDDGDFELLVKEFGFDPGEYFIYKAKHLFGNFY